ncbi:16S rRNA (guanine1516-N2)-methyltransferase [Bacteriovorax stolpii]|nr:class I SAM-dependent methyltransferase [Bacteriovorax stolpii]TDP51002.1 16S rRNA (guanine1516-N2)-methyltransferase [Bacteriovorax stolpii]
MSDENASLWPDFLKSALHENERFSLVVEPERKLCDLCDYLYYREEILSFHSNELGEMSFDFEELMKYHQRQNYALSKEPLAKALAIKGSGEKRVIWDTTCGTGKDSLLISFFGAKLTSFERNPAVFLLLKDALRRFPVDFHLEFGDARTLSHSVRPEVIYYDPMYPAKKKSALARKEMRIFKEIVGDDPDSKEFLEWALKTATERVVVKRPLEADPIKEKPTASYVGKSTRYDMYKIF